MYEAEYKVEISKEEREKLIDLFRHGDFADKGMTMQNDYYIWAAESPFGGNDVKRYRDEGLHCFYTEKVWEEVAGQHVRKEIEWEVSKEELEREIIKYPDAIKIKKDRQSFSGSYQDNPIHIDMDSVKFDHSLSTRYFVEAEMITDKKETAAQLKELMGEFLKKSLGAENIVEAPGMYKMASKKL